MLFAGQLAVLAIVGAAYAASPTAPAVPSPSPAPSPSVTPRCDPSPYPSEMKAPAIYRVKSASPSDPGILITDDCDSIPGLVCRDLLDPVIVAIQATLRTHVDAAYDGHAYVPFPQPSQSPYDSSMTVNTPICDLASGENAKNRKGQECGATSCAFTPGCHVCGNPNCPFLLRGERKLIMVDEEKTCLKERAYKRGALVHEVALAEKEVLGQLLKDRYLKTSGRCSIGALDADFGSAVSHVGRLLWRWTRDNDGRPLGCDKKALLGDPAEYIINAYDPRVPVQEACYLNAALTALSVSVGESALCEILYRAETRWYEKDSERFERALEDARYQAVEECRQASQVIGDPENGLKFRNPAVEIPPFGDCVGRAYASRVEEAVKAAYPGGSYEPSGARTGFPMRGIRECPDGADDCKCAGVTGCPEFPFANAELAAILTIPEHLKSAATSLDRVEELNGCGSHYDLGGNLPKNGVDGHGTGLGAYPSPSPSPWPSPRPRPSASSAPSPAPNPAPAPAPSPAVQGPDDPISVISFPGRGPSPGPRKVSPRPPATPLP